MSRWTSSVFAISISFLSLPSAHADFLIGAPPIGYSARLVHNDGSNSVALTGNPPIHEGYDTFVLSGDGKHIFQFANDLGAITTESWSATTGTYEGAVGPPLHIFNYSPPWPNGIVPNWTIGEVHTRSNFP